MTVKRRRVDDILKEWKPDSHDSTTGGKVASWTWDKAALYMLINDHERLSKIAECVNAEGIGFIDEISPILLGSNGHVWDGHHRLMIAKMMGIEYVLADDCDDV